MNLLYMHCVFVYSKLFFCFFLFSTNQALIIFFFAVLLLFRFFSTKLVCKRQTEFFIANTKYNSNNINTKLYVLLKYISPHGLSFGISHI